MSIKWVSSLLKNTPIVLLVGFKWNLAWPHLDLRNKGQRRQEAFASLQQKIFRTNTNQ